MRERQVILSLVVIIIVLMIFLMANIGYATSSSTLIEDVYPSTNSSIFKVSFDKSTAVITSGSGSINITGDTNMVLNAEGLTHAGDKFIAEVNVKNKSLNVTADLSTLITNSNTEYFKVTAILSQNKITPQNGEAILKIKIELIKTPVYEPEKSNICVKVVAKPEY